MVYFLHIYMYMCLLLETISSSDVFAYKSIFLISIYFLPLILFINQQKSRPEASSGMQSLKTNRVNTMRKAFVKALADYTDQPEAAISAMNHSLHVSIILDWILQPTGQDIRGWRISPYYMNLMTEFGEYLYKKDPFTGWILLEIALQRLSCGAVLHEPTPVQKALPEPYRKYSAACDQYGIMSEDCWKFLTTQGKLCFNIEETCDHVTKIVFGLLDHLTPDGHELNGYMTGQISGKEMYDWAWEIANEEISFKARYDHFATPERYAKYALFFKENQNQIDWNDFFKRIGLNGLKNFFRRREVKKELLR